MQVSLAVVMQLLLFVDTLGQRGVGRDRADVDGAGAGAVVRQAARAAAAHTGQSAHATRAAHIRRRGGLIYCTQVHVVLIVAIRIAMSIYETMLLDATTATEAENGFLGVQLDLFALAQDIHDTVGLLEALVDILVLGLFLDHALLVHLEGPNLALVAFVSIHLWHIFIGVSFARDMNLVIVVLLVHFSSCSSTRLFRRLFQYRNRLVLVMATTTSRAVPMASVRAAAGT